MKDFHDRASDWLITAASLADEKFSIHRDYVWNGQVFPLVEFLEVRDRHPILSIRTEKGRWGVSGEQCYFDICKTLDYESLDRYTAFLKEIQKREVDCKNVEHDYTFLSMVIVTEGLKDHALIRRIKRFHSEKQYRAHKGEYGWSSCRLCVVDLDSNQVICNKMGEALRQRLS